MMKRILSTVFTFVFLSLFTFCSKDKGVTKLTVSHTKVELNSLGDAFKVTITPKDFSASSPQEWISVSQNKIGGGGNY